MSRQTNQIKAPVIRTYDKFLLFIMLMLVFFGALMIYSSTSVVTPVFAKKNISEFYYFQKTFLYHGPGQHRPVVRLQV